MMVKKTSRFSEIKTKSVHCAVALFKCSSEQEICRQCIKIVFFLPGFSGDIVYKTS